MISIVYRELKRIAFLELALHIMVLPEVARRSVASIPHNVMMYMNKWMRCFFMFEQFEEVSIKDLQTHLFCIFLRNSYANI